MLLSIFAQAVALLCLLLWGFWLCCKLRLPGGFGPLLGICFVMLVTQAFGSINQLNLGVQLLLIGAVLSLAHRHRREIAAYLLRPGMLAFLAGVAVLWTAYALRAPRCQTWDEFSHWGIFFKSVFYNDQFAVWDTARSLAHPAYPQGLPGLYALFALLIPEYAEPDVFFTVNLPLLAAGAALFEAFAPVGKRARVLHSACAVAAVPLLFWVFAPDTPYTTIYMDAPVGALFAAALLLTLLPLEPSAPPKARVQRGVAVGLVAAAAVTVKEIGTVFALCVLGIWFLQCLLAATPRQRPWRVLGRAGFWLPFAGGCAPVAAMAASWKLVLAVLNRGDDQFSSMGLGYFLQCWSEARSGFDPYFYDVWGVYYQKFRTAPLLFGFSSFKLGLVCVALSIALAAGLWWAYRRRQGAQLAAVPLCMCVFWPCYQAVLFYVYIGGMSPYEAMRVASYERYACCFFIGWGMVLAGGAFALFAARPALRTAQGTLTLALAALGLWGYSAGQNAFSLPYESWRDDQLSNAAAISDAIADAPQDAGAVWILSADETLAYQNMWYYQYELSPYLVAIEAQSGQSGVDLSYNIEQHAVQYLVLFGTTEEFASRYAADFDDALAAAATAAPAVYRVTAQDGGYRYSLCAN